MSRERDTTDSGEGGIRLRLLDGGLTSAPLDGGWSVGPGLGGGEAWGTGRGDDGNGNGAMRDVGREAWGAEPPAECVVVRNAVRAGDRHEPWVLPVTGGIAALVARTRAVGVDVELAVRLTVECALVCGDLCTAGADPAALDAAAATERVTGELDAASAAYLRRLTGRRGEAVTGRRPAGVAPSGEAVAAPRRAQPAPLGEVVTVGLPLRLSSRLLAADFDALVSAVSLDRALAWETAAVLAGRTMSEWAPLTALRLGG